MSSTAERIAQLMQEKHLNANGLASLLGIQRSNISHLLSGRNKPSLDFVEKLFKAFPDLNLGWLISGEGNAFITAPGKKQPAQAIPVNPLPIQQSKESVNEEPPAAYRTKGVSASGKPVRLILIYEDGRFEFLDQL